MSKIKSVRIKLLIFSLNYVFLFILSRIFEAVAFLSKTYLLISLSTEMPRANAIFSIVSIGVVLTHFHNFE